MKNRKKIFVFIFVILLAVSTYPATYFVDCEKPDDSGSGLSWTEAKKTISAVLNVSSSGDTIIIKYGTYLITSGLSLTSNRMITSDIGTNNSWGTALYDSSRCIIKPDTSVRCRIFTITTNGISNSTHLRGFKITEGEATLETVKTCYGGGILITSDSDPVIENCWVTKNTAATIYEQSYGGGIAITGTGTNPVIQYCKIDSNIAGTTRYGDGGGIASVEVSMPQIQNNNISNNIATTHGSAYGGGIYCNNSYAEISNNNISGNKATVGNYGNAGYGYGGGIYVTNGIVQILSNSITSNIASTSRGGNGGGVYISGNNHFINQNEISNNIGSTGQEGDGGGITCTGELTVTNNIISNNKACISSGYIGRGGGVYMTGMDAILEHNIIDANIASVYGEGRGGGLVFAGHSVAYNIISNNLASEMSDGYGGGAWAYNAASCVLSNNTFYRNANKGLSFNSGNGSGMYYWYGAYNFKMKNNIFIEHNIPGSDTTAIFSGDPLTNNWNNCFYNNGINYNSNVTSHNEVLTDPKLTDPANGDFSLLFNSPCIDAGADTLVYNQTTNHNAGWVVDIGAEEYKGTRVLKNISGTGEYFFGGQVRAKINVTTAGSLSEIDITVHPGETHTNAPASLQRWYEISSTGNGAEFDITLSYKDSELNGETESELNLWRWDGAGWNGPELSSDTSLINNWLTVNGQTSFSDWIISSANDSTALPVNDNRSNVSNYELLQNYPNPFNPTTIINYYVGDAYYAYPVRVTLKVFDVLGNEITTLLDEYKSSGNYEIEFYSNLWNLSSGVYLYQMKAADFIQTRKMILLK